MHLLRKECAYLLGISLSTFDRRVRAGRYGAGVKQGPEQTAEVWYSYADIGLPEPEPSASLAERSEPACEEIPRTSETEPEPEPLGEISPEPEPLGEISPTLPVPEPQPSGKLPERPPSDLEERIAADRAFAEAYLAGEATDSCGNTVNGANERFPASGQATLLGPAVRLDIPKTPRTGTSHMQPELLSDHPNDRAVVNPQVGAGSTRQYSPLAAGYTQEQYDRDMADWRRRRGLPSMSQQREAIERSKAAIAAAFPRGR